MDDSPSDSSRSSSASFSRISSGRLVTSTAVPLEPMALCCSGWLGWGGSINFSLFFLSDLSVACGRSAYRNFILVRGSRALLTQFLVGSLCVCLCLARAVYCGCLALYRFEQKKKKKIFFLLSLCEFFFFSFLLWFSLIHCIWLRFGLVLAPKSTQAKRSRLSVCAAVRFCFGNFFFLIRKSPLTLLYCCAKPTPFYQIENFFWFFLFFLLSIWAVRLCWWCVRIPPCVAVLKFVLQCCLCVGAPLILSIWGAQFWSMENTRDHSG